MKAQYSVITELIHLDNLVPEHNNPANIIFNRWYRFKLC